MTPYLALRPGGLVHPQAQGNLVDSLWTVDVVCAQDAITSEDCILFQLAGVMDQKPDGIIFGGSMSPSTSGAYGAMGKAQLQESDSIRQLYSHQGLFATVEDDKESKNGQASGKKSQSSAAY